jgi:glycosyltransferase involved in cell wall biosynthesis
MGPLKSLLPPGLKDRIRGWLLRPAHRRLWREKTGAAESLARHPAGVNLFGVLDEADGIGEGGRSSERALAAAGIPFARVAVSEAELHGPPLPPERAAAARYAVNWWHLTPGHDPLLVMALGAGPFLGRFNLGYWAWELEEFPTVWDDSYRYFGEIWTPSAFSRGALAARSPVPVAVVPHSVEVRPPERDWRAHFGLLRGRTAFLCMFDLASVADRKNPLGAVRAFRRATVGRRDALLVVKARRPEADPGTWRTFQAELAGLDVKVIAENLSREESWGLVAACDALVSLHRAEGFGLALAEAMALGKPVVATGYSGNMDFMTEENSLPVRFGMRRIERRIGPYPRGYRWAEPDEEHAAARIREALDRPDRARELGHRAARDIAERFSPAAVGRIVRARLEELGLKFEKDGRNA